MHFFIVRILPLMSSSCRALCLYNAEVMSWYKVSTDRMSNTWESSFIESCKCLISLAWVKVRMASSTLYIFLMHFFYSNGQIFVAQTMGKTIFFVRTSRKTYSLSLAQRRGMIRMKWLSFSCRGMSFYSFNYWLFILAESVVLLTTNSLEFLIPNKVFYIHGSFKCLTL